MRNTTTTGFLLGLVGSILDLTSGYRILSQAMIRTNEMGMMSSTYSLSNLVWSISLFVLGAFLLITSLASISQAGLARMHLFGALMIAYGIVMLFVGSAMFVRVAPMMNGYLVSGMGMFLVGALMIVNGALMNRRVMQSMLPQD